MGTSNSEIDVVIVGAGPAGLSAAIWCSDLGLSALVLEAGAAPGGQLNAIYAPILNYPGVEAESGAQLAEQFVRSLVPSKIPVEFNAEVAAIDVDRPTVRLSGGAEYNPKFVVFATGVRRRRMNVPGEDRLFGKGIIASGARDKGLANGKSVAIVGGGDAALENALILSPLADRVYVIHRRGKFTARNEFVERARALDNVEFLFDTEVRQITGSHSVESIEVVDKKVTLIELPVDIVLIRIGVVPNTELVRDQVAVDGAGYVLVDHLGRTSAPRIYAIGDAAMPAAPTIATAVGMGAAAAKSIRQEMDSLGKRD